MTAALEVPYSAGTARPRLEAPAGAADCHIHIYDSRFPPPVSRMARATVEAYRLLQQRLGVSRVVIVTPRNYGVDNSVTLDAIRQLGVANARGIAVVRPDVTDAELSRLQAGGIRGLRFTVGNPQAAVVSIDMIEPLAKRVAPLGWHVQLNMEARQIVENADMLRRLPTPVVFDHLGKLPPDEGIRHPAFGVICELLQREKAWVKISGAYLNTHVGAPYPEATAMAQAYVRAAPERCVWGSDWPHPTPATPPDDAALFDLLSSWAPDAATRKMILVDNPEKLYGFRA